MRVSERATQVWPVLAFAARNRQVLSYGLLSKLIGTHPAGLGQVLEPIQTYLTLDNTYEPPELLSHLSSSVRNGGSQFGRRYLQLRV
jgi:hypothetical protein